MTLSTKTLVTPGLMGVNTAQQDDVPQFALGTEVRFSDNSVYSYCRWTAAKTAGIAYLLDTNFTVGASLTTAALSSLPADIGVPVSTTSAPATGNIYKYGWIQRAGTIALDHCDTQITTAGSLVYTTANAGVLDDTAGSNKALSAEFTATFASGVACSIFAISPLRYSGT